MQHFPNSGKTFDRETVYISIHTLKCIANFPNSDSPRESFLVGDRCSVNGGMGMVCGGLGVCTGVEIVGWCTGAFRLFRVCSGGISNNTAILELYAFLS